MNKCPVCEARKIDYLHKMELRILLNGLIVAPGFGERGIEGKIEAIRFSRIGKAIE